MTGSRIARIAPVLGLLLLISLSLWRPQVAMSQGIPGTISGFAWSDTIGWLSFDCATAGTCATAYYGMSVSEDGTIGGYAWSDGIGWVSAQSADLAGCPVGPCIARIEDGALMGWFRAISSDHPESGGWDGFIALNDVDIGDAVTYGVTLSGNSFSGFGWGDRIVGWLDLSFASTDYDSCALPPGYSCVGDISQYTSPACEVTSTDCSLIGAGWSCVAGTCASVAEPMGTLTLIPTMVRSGGSVQISWDVEDTTSCSVTGNGETHSGGGTGSEASAPISTAVTYTLTCLDAGGEAVVVDTGQVGLIPGWREI